MPKLELGDFESVERLKNVNISRARGAGPRRARDPHLGPVLHADVQAGAAAAVSGDDDVKAVADAMFDPFEYLVLRDKDGLLKKDFKHPLGRIAYHIPCHSRVQNVGQKTREEC
ncbi:MAG: hypothetical protein IPG28_12490 [Betaproteobacteria bacterium]|nr:hypothetical protein [Betaproteobacteria bacterium]